jgi:hypothetical protein
MIRCPKCKSKGEDILLTEYWRDHSIEFQQLENGTIEREGILRDGSPYSVFAKCFHCSHSWRLRGITQIAELTGEL